MRRARQEQGVLRTTLGEFAVIVSQQTWKKSVEDTVDVQEVASPTAAWDVATTPQQVQRVRFEPLYPGGPALVCSCPLTSTRPRLAECIHTVAVLRHEGVLE